MAAKVLEKSNTSANQLIGQSGTYNHLYTKYYMGYNYSGGKIVIYAWFAMYPTGLGTGSTWVYGYLPYSASFAGSGTWAPGNGGYKYWYAASNDSAQVICSKYDSLVDYPSQGYYETSVSATINDGTVAWTAADNVTIRINSEHTVYFKLNGGTASNIPSSATKVFGSAFPMPSETPKRTNYNFLGWKSDISGDNTLYKYSPSATDGNYKHDQWNGSVTLTAQWELAGASVVLDANVYYNEDYLNNDSYTTNNYMFPGTGTNASWTKFTSSAKYNTHPNEYRTGKKTYTPNSNSVAYTVRGTPYTLDRFKVNFCGYYTGKTWSSPGIKTYELKKEWIHGENRNYAVIAVPNNEYFGAATTVSQSDWDLINLYPAGGSGEDDELEQVSSDSLWVPKTAGAKITTPINLPPWLKTARTEPYIFYALWSKPNLTFTYNPGSGTAPANGNNIQLIGTPGPASETGKVQSFTIKTFQQTGITPPIGYKFKEWNTASNGTGRTIAVQTIQLGGYLNDVTLYAQYEQYQHTINIYGVNDTLVGTLNAFGGRGLSLQDISTENPDNHNLKFSGVFDANGVMVFNKNGASVNGNYFTNNLWDYKSDDATLNLYLRWGLPSNAFIYENNEWKQAIISINTAGSTQEPVWEQIDLADFF